MRTSSLLGSGEGCPSREGETAAGAAPPPARWTAAATAERSRQ